jgi:malonyl-CoA O-methyltransferase
MSFCMSDPVLFRLDRRALQRSFDRASDGYDAAAGLQRSVREELLTRLQFFQLEPQRILDLGAGTGAAALQLRRMYPRSRVLAVDLAEGMLRSARRRQRLWRRFGLLCAAANALPLKNGSVDLVFCNLMLQWCDQPIQVFAEVRRVLKPGGLLLYSSFGPETLRELRAAWSAADAHPHVSQFPDMPQLAAAMAEAGLIEPVIDIETRVSYYGAVHELTNELRALGARNAVANRQRSLMGKSRLQTMTQAYELVRVARGLPATYEIIYGAGFAGAAREPTSIPGESLIPLAALKRHVSLI